MKTKTMQIITLNLLAIVTIFIVGTVGYVSIKHSPHYYDVPKTKKATSSTPSQMPTKHLNTTSFYMVKLQDGGKSGPLVGCGDSLVKVSTSSNTQSTLDTALQALLGVKTSSFKNTGLYNALSKSTLTLGSIEMQNGAAQINLIGRYLLSGECDGPRLIGQLTQTVLQFPGIQSAHIFINTIPIEQIFSGAGTATPSAVISQ